MRILFIGDIVGRPGRRIISNYLQNLKQKHHLDFVIANGENSAHGKGMTLKIYNQLMNAGIDCITLGNHAYSKKEIFEDYLQCDNLIFPKNFKNDGRFPSSKRFKIGSEVVVVSNIMGQSFMADDVLDPFVAFQEILDFYGDKVSHIVDFHGEATAEKQLFFRYFSTKATAILGTHTHVQTADEQIVDGCGYMTDVGMTGAVESILGRSIEEVLARTLKNQETYYTVAQGPAMLNGVALTIQQSKTIEIERLSFIES